MASVVIAYMAAMYLGRVTLLQLSIGRHGAHLPYHGCEPIGVIPLLTVTHGVPSHLVLVQVNTAW